MNGLATRHCRSKRGCLTERSRSRRGTLARAILLAVFRTSATASVAASGGDDGQRSWKPCTYFYAPISGYAYLGEKRLMGIAAEVGAKVDFQPVDIQKVFAAAGATPAAQAIPGAPQLSLHGFAPERRTAWFADQSKAETLACSRRIACTPSPCGAGTRYGTSHRFICHARVGLCAGTGPVGS